MAGTVSPSGADTYPLLADYGFISDCYSSALVSRDGSIEWCCFRRFDASPVFARILDRRRGGHFTISPIAPYEVDRRYVPDTNVLETTFTTADGSVTVTDCLVVEHDLEPGGSDDEHPAILLRRVEANQGEVPVRLEFMPRFDYGLTTAMVVPHGPDVVAAWGGADSLVLQSELGPLRVTDGRSCEATMVLRPGNELFASVTHAPASKHRLVRFDRDDLRDRLGTTISAWQAWASRCHYSGPYRDPVMRSALVLKGLTSAATGAVIAAPTTSLPEEKGGVRNWDYRYTWLRDSVYVLIALFRLGYTSEAAHFFRWLKRTTAGRADELQIMYGIGGERLLHEAELHHLDGYAGSRPVRVGNGAFEQFQLDTYGEVVAAAVVWHRLSGRPLPDSVIEFLFDVVEIVADRWEEPDEGIWEVRGERQEFLFSKLLSWLALDQGSRLAEERGATDRARRWAEECANVRRRIENEGVDPSSGCFTQALGSTAVDASALTAPMLGFVPFDDDRVAATIEEVERHLTSDGHVYRYVDRGDGLPGSEGSFVLCSMWLVVNLALSGRVDDAEERLVHLLGHANDLGLLSEEIDPLSGELLGNFPQGFSHIGLISAAMSIEAARTNQPLPLLGLGHVPGFSG